MKANGHNRKQSGAGLHLIIRGIITTARERTAHFKDNPQRHIHHLRTDMKQIRSCLRLIAGSSDGSTAGLISQIRAFKNTLTAHRENAVLLNTLKKLKSSVRIPEKKIFAEVSFDSGKTRRQIDALETAIGKLQIAAVSSDDMKKRFLRSVHRSHKAMRRCLKKPAGKNFHEWRKRMKDVWYQNEVLGIFGKHSKINRHTRQLCEALGEANDLEMLESKLKTVAFEGKRKSLAHIQKKKQKLHRKAVITGKKIFTEMGTHLAAE